MFKTIVYIINISIIGLLSISPGIAAHDNIHNSQLYLEKVDDDDALEWVKRKNSNTLNRLKEDPRYAVFEAAAVEAKAPGARFDYPIFSTGGKVHTLYRDASHLRGIWREADRKDYLAGKPNWQALLDIDELAEREGRDWVYAGKVCLPSDPDKCLLSFSDGGKDAVTVREFDIASRQFVEGGFELLEAKQEVEWVDSDTILLSREWDDSDVTETRSAYDTKVLKRNSSLNEASIFRGHKTENPALNADKQVTAKLDACVLDREECLYELVRNGDRPIFPAPSVASLVCDFDGQVIMKLKDTWTSAQGRMFPEDSLISFELLANMSSPEQIEPKLIFSPMPHQALGEIHRTKGYLLAEVLSDVDVGLVAFRYGIGCWDAKQFQLPQNISVSAVTVDEETDDFVFTIENFLRPTSIYWGDASTLEVKLLQTDPEQFDASNMEVVRHWVKSKDGTSVPYFMVAQKDLVLDGSNPTLIYGYGGFEVSMTPSYLGVTGKIWLENGGVYVLPNIRGGGEFGEKWHRAGLKTNRQAVYDDFQAVAEDLITRKVTSPAKLGISGGSNGGLLTGVQLVQRPDLWKAVVISVPLLDMMRYNLLFDGASWMSEYGDPADPIEGAFLHSISPYHNLKPETDYPEPLLITSKTDDRVHPGHARKMAAKMDALNKRNLFFESNSGGHSGAKTSWDEPDAWVLEWVYLTQKLMS